MAPTLAPDGLRQPGEHGADHAAAAQARDQARQHHARDAWRAAAAGRS